MAFTALDVKKLREMLFLIILITSSMKSSAIFKPSRM